MARRGGARRAVLAAWLAAGLLAPVAAPAAASAEGPAPGEPAEVAIDAGPARANPLDPALLPPGLVDDLLGRRPAAGAAKAGVGSLRPDGSSGFLPFRNHHRAFGAYRFQLVDSGSDGDEEVLRTPLQAVAAELTEVTRLEFRVEPGVVARPLRVDRFPTGWCGDASGHRCSLFADDDATVGVIRVEIAASSPCGPLAPRDQSSGTIGCAGPESAQVAGSTVNARGNVWVSPSVLGPNRHLTERVLAHEIAHALGLDHYDRLFSDVAGHQPVRQLLYPSVHADPSDTGGQYRSGDRNGLRWLQLPEAWFLAATYRHFLGRVPDPDGYRFWLASRTPPAAYVDALAGSDEWVGRIVTAFYRDVFGRSPDPGGFAHWTGQVRLRGVPFVASQLYGSAEYVVRNGGTLDGAVAALYRQLLGRDPAADPAGVAYWVGQARLRGLPAAAHDLFQSLEKRMARVHELYCTLLERPPDPGGHAHWAGAILVQGDLALARELATSAEYRARADELALRPTGAPPAC